MFLYGSGPTKIKIAEMKKSEWFPSVAAKIVELCFLRENWDSYGAKPIEPKAAIGMLKFLSSILDANAPAPWAVPTAGGGISVEWTRNEMDLDIEFSPTGQLSYFFTCPGEEHEGAVEKDISEIEDLIKRILT